MRSNYEVEFYATLNLTGTTLRLYLYSCCCSYEYLPLKTEVVLYTDLMHTYFLSGFKAYQAGSYQMCTQFSNNKYHEIAGHKRGCERKRELSNYTRFLR